MSRVEQLVVETTSLDETIEALRTAFGQVSVHSDDGRAGHRLEALAGPGLTSAVFGMEVHGHGALDLLAGADDPVYLTGYRRSGGFDMWSGRDAVDADRPYLYPDRMETRLEHFTAATLGISRSAVQQRARALTGRDDLVLRFTGTAPVDPRLDRQWRSTVDFVHASLRGLAGTDGHGLALAGLVDLVAASLLDTFPSTALEAADGGARSVVGSAAVRRALQHIEDHLDQPITAADIAAAARLSVRGLDDAFRRHLGTTPTRYLRDRRLAGARRALQAGDPATTGVAEIATAWGFPHHGRFAALYRATYGENPGDTLRD